MNSKKILLIKLSVVVFLFVAAVVILILQVLRSTPRPQSPIAASTYVFENFYNGVKQFDQGQKETACNNTEFNKQVFCLEGFYFQKHSVLIKKNNRKLKTLKLDIQKIPQALGLGLAIGHDPQLSPLDVNLQTPYYEYVIDAWAFMRVHQSKMRPETLPDLCRIFRAAEVRGYCEFGAGRASYFIDSSAQALTGPTRSGYYYARVFAGNDNVPLDEDPIVPLALFAKGQNTNLESSLQECLKAQHATHCTAKR